MSSNSSKLLRQSLQVLDEATQGRSVESARKNPIPINLPLLKPLPTFPLNQILWKKDFTEGIKTGIPMVWHSFHKKFDEYSILLLKAKQVLNEPKI